MLPFHAARFLSISLCLTALSGLTIVETHAQTKHPIAQTERSADLATVPLTDPIYADAEIVENAGIVMMADSDFPTSGRHAIRRVVIVQSIARFLPMLTQTRIGNNATPSSQQLWRKLQRELSDKFSAHPEAIGAMTRMVEEFAPDLQRLGAHPEEAKSALADFANPSPFPDVPRNHWAARAVRELKAIGIVIGEPDGQFQHASPS